MADEPVTTPPVDTTPAPAPVSPPPFMEGVIDPTAIQVSARDVLSGDDPGSEDEPKKDENGNPVVEAPKVDENGNPVTETPPVVPVVETPKVDENGKPVAEAPKVDANGQPVVETPKTEEEKRAELENRVLDNASKTAEAASQEEINKLISRPLVNFEAPDPANYQGKDGFDLKGYLGDALKSFTLELQKSMAGGGMAAVQFKVLKNALQSESKDRITESVRQEEAKVIWDGITGKFPVLKNEESPVTKSFIRAVLGEKRIRLDEAQKAGKQPVDLTLADYEELAKDVLKDVKPTTPKTNDPVETIPGGPSLTENGQPKDAASKEIDDMMRLKKSSGSIF